MAKCYGELGIVAIGTGLACDTDVHDFHRLLHPDLLISTSGRLIEGISLDEQKAARYKINGFFSEYKVLKERFGKDASTLMRLRACLFSCTSASLAGPMGYDQELCREIEEVSGCEHGLTTTTAALAAFRTMGVRGLSIVTPYPDEVADQEKIYFEQAGFPCVNINNLPSPDVINPFWIMHQDPEFIKRFAVEHFDKRADCLFLSCTGLCVLDIIKPLEDELGVPVLTSNQCAAWYIGEILDARRPENAAQYGCLFDHRLG